MNKSDIPYINMERRKRCPGCKRRNVNIYQVRGLFGIKHWRCRACITKKPSREQARRIWRMRNV